MVLATVIADTVANAELRKRATVESSPTSTIAVDSAANMGVFHKDVAYATAMTVQIAGALMLRKPLVIVWRADEDRKHPAYTTTAGVVDSIAVSTRLASLMDEGCAALDDDTRQRCRRLGLTGAILHELAHVLVAAWGVPVGDRDEQIADQVMVVMAVRARLPEAAEFVALALPAIGRRDSFAAMSIHGNAATRGRGMACLVRGAKMRTGDCWTMWQRVERDYGRLVPTTLGAVR